MFLKTLRYHCNIIKNTGTKKRTEAEASRVENGRILKRIRDIDLKEEGHDWSADLLEERRELKQLYFRILESKDIALRLKCKTTWAREGDANTKLFHRLLNARKSRNTISKLENAERFHRLLWKMS